MKTKKRGRPPKFTDTQEMQKIIDSYFEKHQFKFNKSYQTMPTVSGLAQALNMNRRTLLNYSKKDKFAYTVRRARQRIEIALEHVREIKRHTRKLEERVLMLEGKLKVLEEDKK